MNYSRHFQNNESKQTLVVIGNGMVGLRLLEKIIEKDRGGVFDIYVFGEEAYPAYDRVNLTSYFDHHSRDQLVIQSKDWYERNQITLHLGDPVLKIDRKNKLVLSKQGLSLKYDKAVLAMGSSPFVPSIPGTDKKGVFVYRSIEDLDAIFSYAKKEQRVAVIGGGLLGLEAARAVCKMGLETHIVEFASRLMPRQIDEPGSRVLEERIKALGVHIHLNKQTQEILGSETCSEMVFKDNSRLAVDMIVISAGIKPRDELGKECGLLIGERGGIVVNEKMCTSDESLYALGEVASFRGMIYGLVAPGYEMAEVVAAQLLGEDRLYSGSDLSTKLKLMEVDVASFGDVLRQDSTVRTLTFEDKIRGIYKRLVVSNDGKTLLGGSLIGDTSGYGQLWQMMKNKIPLPLPLETIIFTSFQESRQPGTGGAGSLPPTAEICSCHNVSKKQICDAIQEKELLEIGAVKACTKAATGCGGCLPLIADILQTTLKALGKKVNHHICEHFPFSRPELFQIVKIKKLKTFMDVLKSHGKGAGCEKCQPAVSSILAGLWNEPIIEQQVHQDSNDRYLANIQKGGTYSVVPRVPGGEITPEKLIVLGQVAKKFNLYCKITGGQRIDLFGARVDQLPDIWEDLIRAGFESGHAYGKAMRTVKSCIGTSWCRYGVQDSVKLAIRIENRYKGIRAPHKMKAAVSGCIRECAEAQNKDFGVIATEKGWNVYLCGNGGAKPQHAQLLAQDIDEETVIKYLDRFIMYYIRTADPLTRTAAWLNKLEGGFEYLKEVIIHDKLGICETLEKEMAYLVDTYQCEWKEVVDNPEKRKLFRHFVNCNDTDQTIEFVYERGQKRPLAWNERIVADVHHHAAAEKEIPV